MRLILSGLACERGGRMLFEGLDASLHGGEALCLTGPNGSGKSSLLAIIAGLLAPRAGRARLEAGAGERPPLADNAHLLGHRDALKTQLSVGENLRFWQQLNGADGFSRDEALSAFGVRHLLPSPVAFLSAGQKRRVALARLLVSRRALWLLDEPTAALDAGSRALLATAMRQHLDAGGLIVAATHEPLGLPARELRLAA